MNRTLRTLVVIGAAIACLLMFILVSAGRNTQFFDHYYYWLLGANAAAALALLALVVTLSVRLIKRVRQGAFGALLMARLAVAFALMGVVPGVLIYVISTQYLTRSLDSRFNVRVDVALESGLNLGRAAMDQLSTDLTSAAQDAALELSEVADANLPSALARTRERSRSEEVLVFTSSGRTVAFAGSRFTVLPDIPPASVIQQARSTRNYSGIEGFADDAAASAVRGAAPDLRIRVVVAIPAQGSRPRNPRGFSLDQAKQGMGLGGSGDSSKTLGPEQRYLQLIQAVPSALSSNAQTVQSGYRDYQELSLGRNSLRNIYTVTLTMALLLATFASLGIAVALAQWMARPLLRLAEGTRAVAQGDFRLLPSDDRKDELGALTTSFNAMTTQLSDAQRAVQQKQDELSQTNLFMQSVMDNLSSGVLVCDSDFVLRTFNPGAERILGLPLGDYAHTHFGNTVMGKPSALAAFEEAVAQAFSEHDLQDASADYWQRQLELPRAHDPDHKMILLARGCWLTLPNGRGSLIVFDDISEVVSAQRAKAWGEVAQRLAHEIKNPLTPIQLAAERLQIKLADHVQPEQASVLARSTNMIISQVASMKRLVDDFREYARTPPARLEPLELNQIVLEVLALYGWDSAQLQGKLLDRGVWLEVNLTNHHVQIEGDPTQLRQIVHNLINNAQDALRPAQDSATPPNVLEPVTERVPTIQISTTLVSSQQSGNTQGLRLSINDNGTGFAPKLLKRAFEPYVTTKPGGTGLGLAIVKKIVEEHGARIDLNNRTAVLPSGSTQVLGASVSVLFGVL